MKKITLIILITNTFGYTIAHASSEQNNIVKIHGNFSLIRNNIKIIGEGAKFDKKNKIFEFNKSPQIIKDGIKLKSFNIIYDDKKSEITAINILKKYDKKIGNKNNNKNSIIFQNNYLKTDLLIKNNNGFIAKNIEYSTCSCENVDDKIWYISASELNSKADDKPVTLKDFKFKVKGLTVLKLPYILLPPTGVNRFEGWLFPKFGQTSKRGFWVENQYYQVIDDNSDLTYGVLNTTKYGTKVANEFRKNSKTTKLKTYFSSSTHVNKDNQNPAFVDIDYAKYMKDGFKFKTNLIGTNDETYMKEFYDDEYNFKSYIKSSIKVSRLEHNSKYSDISFDAYKNIKYENEKEIPFSPNLNYIETYNFKPTNSKAHVFLNVQTIDQVNNNKYKITNGYVKTSKKIANSFANIELDASLLVNNTNYNFLYPKNQNNNTYTKGSLLRTSPGASALITKSLYKFDGGILKELNFKAGYFIKKSDNNPEFLVNKYSYNQNYDNSTLFKHRFQYSENRIDDITRYAFGVEYNKTSNNVSTLLFIGRNKNIRDYYFSKYIINMSKTFNVGENKYAISTNSEHDEDSFETILWNFNTSFSDKKQGIYLNYYESEKSFNNILPSAKVSNLTYKRHFAQFYDISFNLENDHHVNKGPLSRNIILNYNNECFGFTTYLKRTYNSNTGRIKDKKLLFTFELKT